MFLSRFLTFVYRCLILLFDSVFLIVHLTFKEFNLQVIELLFLCFLHFMMSAISTILFTFCKHFFSLQVVICVHFPFPFSLCNNLFFFIAFHLGSSSFSILHFIHPYSLIKISNAV